MVQLQFPGLGRQRVPSPKELRRREETEKKQRRREKVRGTLASIRERVEEVCGRARQADDFLATFEELRDSLGQSEVQEVLPARANKRLNQVIDWYDLLREQTQSANDICRRTEEALDYADRLLSRPETVLEKILDKAVEKGLDTATRKAAGMLWKSLGRTAKSGKVIKRTVTVTLPVGGVVVTVMLLVPGSGEANVPPDVEMVVGPVVRADGVYQLSVYIKDPDSESWEAVVDYGDGSSESFAVASPPAFSVSHRYTAPGAYALEITITDESDGVGRYSSVVPILAGDRSPAPGPDPTLVPVAPTTVPYPTVSPKPAVVPVPTPTFTPEPTVTVTATPPVPTATLAPPTMPTVAPTTSSGNPSSGQRSTPTVAPPPTTPAATVEPREGAARLVVNERQVTGPILTIPQGTIRVDPAPDLLGLEYSTGTTVTLTVEPSTGYSFGHWGGDCPEGSLTCILEMDANKTVTVHYYPTYQLTVNGREVNGPSVQVSGGSVAVSPVPNRPEGRYSDRTQVTLTPMPGSDHDFGSWGDDCSGSGRVCTLDMDRDKVATVKFVPKAPVQTTYVLTVEALPSDGGKVDVVPAANGPDAKYREETLVTLTALPTPGFALYRWEGGGCTGSKVTCDLTINADTRVVGHFQRVFCLSVNNQTPEGANMALYGGQVNIASAPAIAGGCYFEGAVVDLTPQASRGFVFTGWTGACASAGANPCRLVMSGDQKVGAQYLQTFALTVGGNPVTGPTVRVNNGTVTVSPAPNAPDNRYLDGTVVSLRADPNPGYQIQAWPRDCGVTKGVCAVTMKQDLDVTPVFVQQDPMLTVEVLPSNGGSVAVSPLPDAPNGRYRSGTTVTLSAFPASGYVLVGWDGDCAGAGNRCTLTMDGDKKVIALFEVAFQVTDVRIEARPVDYVGSCPVTITFMAEIFVVGDRGGEVTYIFERSDNYRGPKSILRFSGPGSQQVSTTWTLGDPGSSYSGWLAIRILDPIAGEPRAAKFYIRCDDQRERLPTPRQVSPEAGATLKGPPGAVVFSWEPVAWKDRLQYVVEVDCFLCCDQKAWCSEVGKPWWLQQTPETQVMGEFREFQQHRWRIWAVDDAGNRSLESSWAEFKFAG